MNVCFELPGGCFQNPGGHEGDGTMATDIELCASPTKGKNVPESKIFFPRGFLLT